MGHLVNPISFRLGVSRYWNSRWITQNTYKYNFMFKSDWNIYKFLVRLFSREELISLGLVFSHVIFIRTSTIFYSIVYFWDGKTLQNLNDNLKKLLFKLSRYKILTKFFIVMNFFFKFFKFKFFFEKLVFFYFWKVNNKFTFFRLIFQYFIFLFISCTFSKKNNMLKIFFYIRKKLLKIYIKIFLDGLLKQLSYFLFFFNLYRIFLLKLNIFLSNFLRNLIFFDYVYRNLNFFLNKDRSSFIAIYSTLSNFVKKFTSNLSLEKGNFKLLLRPMSKLDINSAFIARYLAIRMQQRYRLMQALSPVFGDLRKSPLVNGYRIACSGRFTKKEIATYEWFRFGGVPTNTLSAHLDYWSVPFILKYSMCSFKVWINKKQKDKNYNEEEFRNSFLDMLFPYRIVGFRGNFSFLKRQFVKKQLLNFFRLRNQEGTFSLKNFLKLRLINVMTIEMYGKKNVSFPLIFKKLKKKYSYYLRHKKKIDDIRFENLTNKIFLKIFNKKVS